MTRCASVCPADPGPSSASRPLLKTPEAAAEPRPERIAARPSRQALMLDQREIGRRAFCSWHDLGWRSVLLREFISASAVADAEVPALADQLVVLILSGTKVIESRTGRRWRRACYVPGRIAMTAPGRPARLRWQCPSGEPQRALHLHVPGRIIADAAEQVWEADSSRVSMPDTLIADDPVVEQVMRALGDAAARRAGDLYAESAAAFLAVHLVSRHAGLGDVPQRGAEASRMRQAEQYMRDNLHTPTTLADIAGSVHLSQYHFLRLFKNATGEPPRSYLTRLRVERARDYLIGSRSTVGEIAELCGFTNAAHLTAAFRRLTGTSPTAFRRQHTKLKTAVNNVPWLGRPIRDRVADLRWPHMPQERHHRFPAPGGAVAEPPGLPGGSAALAVVV